MALSPPPRRIPTDLRGHSMQRREVVLNGDLTFNLWEAMSQPRPNQWARIWPASLALSRWFLRQPIGSLPSHARELGCGVGLVGMTLAHLGVQVECTDREPLALAFTSRNAADNGLESLAVRVMDWGFGLAGPTALLVASDVLYEDATPDRLYELLQTGGQLADDGRLLLSGPRHRPESLGLLVDRLVGAGYSHATESADVDWDGRVEVIDVHALRKPMGPPAAKT